MQKLLIASCLLILPAQAQIEAYFVNGSTPGDRFGSAVCAVGDVDADGVGDLAIGAPHSDAGATNGGQVTVVSGRTRQAIRTWTANITNGRFGASLAACGDLNGDGSADVVVGAPGLNGGPNGSVFVISGADGAVLHNWTGAPGFGIALAADGDVTGDGVVDVLVGSPLANEVKLFDGASGALVRQHADSSYLFGSSVAYLGDVTGDGLDEYTASDPDTWGTVRVYRGSTGAVHWTASGGFGDQLGVALASVADLTGDGLPELLAGAGDSGSFGSDSRGYVRVFDGTNGAVVDTVHGANFDDRLGSTLAAAGDLDGDSSGDFVVAHLWTYPLGAVQVRRGSDRAIVASLTPVTPGIAWGEALSFGDVSGDGLTDVIVGAPLADTGGADAGAVYVYTLVRAPVIYCESELNSLGCTPTIGSSGVCSATLATTFDVNAFNVLNNKSGLLFYGFKPRQTPFQGGHMCIVAPTQRTSAQSSGGATPPTSDCSGAFSYDFNARIQSGVDAQLVAGEEVFAQYWSRDPADSSTTNLSNALAFFIAL